MAKLVTIKYAASKELLENTIFTSFQKEHLRRETPQLPDVVLQRDVSQTEESDGFGGRRLEFR